MRKKIDFRDFRHKGLLGIRKHPPESRKVTTPELFPALFIITNIHTFDYNSKIPVTPIWETIQDFRLYPTDQMC